MNNTRLKAIEDGQTGIAKKVLSVVPLTEAWTMKQIVMEIARVGSCPDPRIVEGCLSTLKDAGLIKEPKRGEFIRVRVKDEAEPEERTVVAIKSQPFALVESKRPLDRMATLAARMRNTAAEMKVMADEAEEVALAFEEEVNKASKDGAKLKQLQELLRGLA